MNAARTATLRRVTTVLGPADARLERVVALAAAAIDGLSPGRRRDLERFLDLLYGPLRLPDAQAARTLAGLADSAIPLLRTGFAALKRLLLFLAYAETEPGAPNPAWRRIRYPGPPPRPAFFAAAPLTLSLAGEGERIEADVVVVGSGAGGGTFAAACAERGLRVVVLEAGSDATPRSYDRTESSLADLYLEGGLAASSDLGVVVLAGATLGGGTAINWCTSFRLPERIAGDWERQSGIAGLGAALAPHYDALEADLGIAAAPAHNANNAVVAAGAAKLGLHAAAMPRNARDCGDDCGWCGFGCARERKQSTLQAFLPRVVARGGAVYARARAERIVVAGGRAHGVAGTQRAVDGTERHFVVEAPLVVAAAGTLRTPGLLARSGIAHPLLGKRLFLHPVSAVMPTFSRPIEAWSGPMQTAYSDAIAFREGAYGAKIEVAPTHPGLAALALPWRTRAEHAALMDRVRDAATLIAVTRDRYPGEISLDDEATIRYDVSPFDGDTLLAGIETMVEVAFAAGADRVTTLHAEPLVLHRHSWSAHARDGFARRLRAVGTGANRQPFFSAHQMGTACMGTDPSRSVVDEFGRVRGVEGLIVADASVFPQASGVNPMLTIMALALRSAEHALAGAARRPLDAVARERVS